MPASGVPTAPVFSSAVLASAPSRHMPKATAPLASGRFEGTLVPSLSQVSAQRLTTRGHDELARANRYHQGLSARAEGEGARLTDLLARRFELRQDTAQESRVLFEEAGGERRVGELEGRDYLDAAAAHEIDVERSRCSAERLFREVLAEPLFERAQLSARQRELQRVVVADELLEGTEELRRLHRDTREAEGRGWDAGRRDGRAWPAR